MNITRTVYLALIALLALVGGASWYFGHLQGQKAAQETTITEAKPLLPPPRHYIILYSYTYAAPAAYPSAGPVSVVRRSGVIAFGTPSDAQILKIANLHKPVGPRITETNPLAAIQIPDLSRTTIPPDKWVDLTHPESNEPPQ